MQNAERTVIHRIFPSMPNYSLYMMLSILTVVIMNLYQARGEYQAEIYWVNRREVLFRLFILFNDKSVNFFR